MEDAAKLAQIAGRLHCHVNLIPVNPVKERSYERPSRAVVNTFMKTLSDRGVNVTVRREMGTDISGACGQLRRGYTQKPENRPKEGGA